MPVSRVNYESKPITLQLRDIPTSTATTPWTFQLFQTFFPFSEDPNTYLKKSLVCANIAQVGASEACCTQKRTHRKPGSPSLNLSEKQQQQNNLEVKLGESQMNQPSRERGTLGEGSSTTNHTATWIWPAKDDKDVAVKSLQHPMTQVVPRISGSSKPLVGSPVRSVTLVNGKGSECNMKRGLVGMPPGWKATNCTGVCKYHEQIYLSLSENVSLLERYNETVPREYLTEEENRTETQRERKRVCESDTCQWDGGVCKDKCKFNANTNTCVENTTKKMWHQICDNHRDRPSCEDFPGSLCLFTENNTCVNKCNSKQNAASCDAVKGCNYDVNASTCVDNVKAGGPRQSDGVGSGAMLNTMISDKNAW